MSNDTVEDSSCQPIVVCCGRGASINFSPKNASKVFEFSFSNHYALFDYEIRIVKFNGKHVKAVKTEENYYLVEIFICSDDINDDSFCDSYIFNEKNLEDLIEYVIILPRLFKIHHRYILVMERDNVCFFKDFGYKVDLWKQATGIM